MGDTLPIVYVRRLFFWNPLDMTLDAQEKQIRIHLLTRIKSGFINIFCGFRRAVEVRSPNRWNQFQEVYNNSFGQEDKDNNWAHSNRDRLSEFPEM